MEYRSPDKSLREQLLPDSRPEFEKQQYEFQKQLDQALLLSLQLKQEEDDKLLRQEEDIINNYNTETNRRTELFKTLLFDLNKLIRFDKDVKEIYDIIEPIINSYCFQYIEKVELDILTYDKIFTVVCGIRTNKNNIDLLRSILFKCD
jgi:hypothetical protein